ncbi:MAG: N-acetylneuraminate synthase family protein [Deltaproteobacteria bacterium]|nr:N-acetylneuraminate synthase family protein [Candidatus Anaeroferrophillacea bacterium]
MKPERIRFDALQSTFVVAEIGVNHEGDVRLAEKMIRQAAAAGADAVKFQTYTAEHYISIVQPERLARVRRFQLSGDEFRRLKEVADEAGTVFFSTPLHPDDVDFLTELVPFFKVSSGDLTYLPLIRHIAATGKPMIISTGLGTRDEIQAALDTVTAVRPGALTAGEVMLMHCVSAYPTPPEEANLNNLFWLQKQFGVPVGYSDHTLGTTACEIAVAMGARVIEKHFTYRKEDQQFHDHAISADPEDLQRLIGRIREIEIYLGSADRRRTPAEEKGLPLMRRSLAAAVDIPAGVPVREEWITFLRPAWGLGPEAVASLVGRPLTRPVSAGELIRPEDVG